MRYRPYIKKQLSLSPMKGRGMGLELLFHYAQQKLGGTHDGQCGVFLKTFPVVRDNHLATTSYGTLVLHHVFEITNGSICHSVVELCRIHRQNLYGPRCFLQTIMDFLSATSVKKVGHRGKGNGCNTIADYPPVSPNPTIYLLLEHVLDYRCNPSIYLCQEICASSFRATFTKNILGSFVREFFFCKVHWMLTEPLCLW